MRRRASLGSLTVGLAALVVGACFSSRSNEPGSTKTLAPTAIDEAALARGEALMNRYQCVACHAPDPAAIAFLEPEPAPVLAGIGARKTPEALRRWILAPHAVGASTRMPDLLARLPRAERESVAGDLSVFLATLGGPLSSMRAEFDIEVLERGRRLFHGVGCVACHTPQESADDLSAPLWSLDAGTAFAPVLGQDLAPGVNAMTLDSLARFLVDPLASRPSGRMPSMKLDHAEARAIAAYLVRGRARVGQRSPGWRSEYFEGSIDSAASDFAGLVPVTSEVVTDVSRLPEHREENFGFRWSGLIDAPKTGLYEFFTTSDDGSTLYVDGKLVVDNDGTHPATEKSGALWLESGLHAVRVTMFEGAHQQELSVSWKPPAGAKAVLPAEALSHWDVIFEPADAPFLADPNAIERGRRAFGDLGCAVCHPLPGVPVIRPAAPPLADLARRADRGCLADAPRIGATRFALDASSLSSLRAAVRALDAPPRPRTPQAVLAAKLERFNCLACHARDGVGGPEEGKHEYFQALVEVDLGNEGRLPPRLDAVGTKLYADWMTRVLVDGAVERPYLATRMPLFGASNVADLGPLFEQVDGGEVARAREPFALELAEAGRKLAGTSGLGCVQCHDFNGVRSLGIPAVDLAHVSERIKPAWIRQLLLDPKSLGMNSRMPIFWDSNGVSAARTILEGDPKKQVEALCSYLSLGRSMPLPPGLVVPDGEFELVPESTTILCGVFLRGWSARVLLVGSPELVHYAFDLENSALVCAWRGRFFNAKGTWNGRAGGLEWPPGDDLLSFAQGPTFAFLPAPSAPWPNEMGREADTRRLGTSYDARRRPAFRYRVADVEVRESCAPLVRAGRTLLARTFDLRAARSVDDLFLRADPRREAPLHVDFVRGAEGAWSAHVEVEVAW